MIELICENLEKRFINKLIFKGVNFKLKTGDSLAITGRNGSGKSTLIKIIANLIKATSGKITLRINNKEILKEDLICCMGFCAPYLNLYEEFTAYENLEFFMKLKCEGESVKEKINNLLNRVNLYNCRNNLVREYSTGMKQKLKLAFALINEPKLLLLDEPQSNLDFEGIELINTIIEEQNNRGILIIASNEIWKPTLFNITLNIENFK